MTAANTESLNDAAVPRAESGVETPGRLTPKSPSQDDTGERTPKQARPGQGGPGQGGPGQGGAVQDSAVQVTAEHGDCRVAPVSLSSSAGHSGADSIAPASWLHRLTVLILCLVWPLIWVGGLVTTYDAGMSVPDWPGTYGYNLFLYPYQTWLLGPFDLFIEHGHRLLGAVVGLVAIAIVGVALFSEPRRWVKGLCLMVLVMVIAQGILGGARVVLSDRTLAMVHGCFGPAFFAVCVAAAVVTGRHWSRRFSVAVNSTSPASSGKVVSPVVPGSVVAVMVTGLVAVSYLQLLLGAMIRHVQPTASPSHFAGIVSGHILTAFGLWLLTGCVWLGLRRCGDLTLSRPSVFLIGLVGLQIALGIGTWVVNYGWPSFMSWVPGAQGFLVQSKGFVDSMIVTGHVAVGSLILAVSSMLWVRLLHRRWQASGPAAVATPMRA